MAMSISDLASKFHTALSGVMSVGDDSKLQSVCTALATAIVNEIQTNAVVAPGTFSNSGGPVTGAGTVG